MGRVACSDSHLRDNHSKEVILRTGISRMEEADHKMATNKVLGKDRQVK